MYTKSARGCWTCKDRRIACDKHLPTCQKCTNSGRECLGYGVRLSWPRSNDGKRAILAKNTSETDGVPTFWFDGSDFVNVFVSDVIRSRNLLYSSIIEEPTPSLRRLRESHKWMPVPFNGPQFDLSTFYRTNVAQLLTLANHSQVQNLLLRMSFHDASPASSSILRAIYAISTLQISNHGQALDYSRRAIKDVWASATQDTSPNHVCQRIVAANFLAIFETLLHSQTSNEMTADIYYAKEAAIATFDPSHRYQGDLQMILDWVYYYDVLSRFGAHHYGSGTTPMLASARTMNLTNTIMNSRDTSTIVPTLGCCVEVICAISCVIDTVSSMERSDDSTYIETLNKTERQLKFAQQQVKVENMDDLQSTQALQRIRDIAELYRLAGLIYLYRAGRGTSVSNPILRQFTTDAFQILNALETCERTFPLFIIGCEARTEVHRATITRVTNGTQHLAPSNNIVRVRGFIERFWAQEDLDSGQELHYALKMTSVLSTAEGMPVWV